MSWDRRIARRAARRSVGPIAPGQTEGVPWTFTRDRWTDASYLWLRHDAVYLSALQARARGSGYLRDLIAGIEADPRGLRVVVPNPLGHMRAILEHYGFAMHLVKHEGTGDWVDVWQRPIHSRSEPSR